jgi:hypothetical protein
MKSNRREFLKKSLYGGLALSVTGSYAGAAQHMNSGTEPGKTSANTRPRKGQPVMGLRCAPPLGATSSLRRATVFADCF